MAQNKDTQEQGLVEVNDVTITTELKEIAKKGEDGQFITLVDLEHTKTILTDLSEKYKGLEVTKDNYKKEGADAERELRQTRYALQRIYKSNNSFLNEVKNNEKATYEGLIELIQPQEKRIYDQVNAFKEIEAKAKEEEARKEKERVEKIEQALKEAEFAMEKAIIQGKTQEDLAEYDKFMEEFKSSFPSFEEMEFQAKRLHAIYTAKRSQLVTQVEEYEELERKRKEQAEKDEKRAEQLTKIYEARKALLIKKGFELTHLDTFDGFGLEITVEEVKTKDEVEWYEFIEEAGDKVAEFLAEQERKAKEEAEAKEKAEKEEQERKEKEERDALIKARKDWDDMVIQYQALGGDPKLWKLRKDEIPSSDEIADLAKALKDLHAQKRLLKQKEVKADIEPYKDEVLDFLKAMDEKISGAKFKNIESKTILENFKNRTLEVVNEVFGEVYNN